MPGPGDVQAALKARQRQAKKQRKAGGRQKREQFLLSLPRVPHQQHRVRLGVIIAPSGWCPGDVDNFASVC